MRNAAAERLKLDPGVLCPKGTLEAIAAARPKNETELRAVPDVRKWQVEALGREILSSLAG